MRKKRYAVNRNRIPPIGASKTRQQAMKDITEESGEGLWFRRNYVIYEHIILRMKDTLHLDIIQIL